MRSVIKLALAGIGLVCLACALTGLINTQVYLARAERAQGTVVEVVGSRDSDGGMGYVPRVRYSVEGRPYEIMGATSTNPPAYYKDQNVDVLFSRANPSKGTLDVWMEHYLLVIICTVIGLAFLAAGIWGR